MGIFKRLFNKKSKLRQRKVELAALMLLAVILLAIFLPKKVIIVSAELPPGNDIPSIDTVRILVFDRPLEGEVRDFENYRNVKINEKGEYRVSFVRYFWELPDNSYFQLCIDDASFKSAYQGKIKVCDKHLNVDSSSFDYVACNRVMSNYRFSGLLERARNSSQENIHFNSYCERVY